MKLERIATVKATGKKYVVQQLDFRTGRCHCWGEVMSFEFKSGTLVKRRHDVSVSFPLHAVAVAEAELTPDLMTALFEQSKKAHAALIESGRLEVKEPKRGRRR